MSPEAITQLILHYRYWILVPLSLVEGPVVAFIAGTLASVGFFDITFLAVFFFIRDIALDAGYYALGHFGGKTRFAQKMLARLGITADHLGRVRALWVRRPGWTMLIGKLSYGIASTFIVVAGMVRMPLTLFFGYGALVVVLEYGSLLFAGYFLGASFGGSAARLISSIQYLIAGASVVLVAYYLISWKMRSSFLKEDKEIEDEPV